MKEKILETLKALNEFRKQEFKTTVGEMLGSLFAMLVFGSIVGLAVFGWWLWPVQYEPPPGMNGLEYEPPPGMNGLEYNSKAMIVEAVADHYAMTGNNTIVFRFISQMNDFYTVACTLQAQENKDFARKARLITVAALQNGYGCE